MITSFLFFLGVFTLIGISSSLKSKKSNSDYLLAGQDVPPWLVALSAVATNNSGYMFIGMIGYTYTIGLSSVWLMIGWIVGDYIASLYVHKKLRNVSEKRESLSFGGVISNWFGTEYKYLRVLIGIATFIFLGVYAGAQFKAGSKALHVLLGWDLETGAIIGAVMVLLYCMAGGIRASIWTDAAQSFVMIISMSVLTFYCVSNLGGIESVLTQLDNVNPNYLSLIPSDLAVAGPFGVVLFIAGWIGGGLGVIGQPHIMVRFMAMDNSENIGRVRTYYYSWFTAFYALTTIVGLMARVLIPEVSQFDQELALPVISKNLLPATLVGLILAGLFAATMSTADSLILSCSAAFTRDILPKKRIPLIVTKLATVSVTGLALYIALYGQKNVFNLVLLSWSLLAAGFGPLLFLYSTGKRISERTSILIMLTGMITTITWKEMGLGSYIYEIAPGMLSGFVVFYLARIFESIKINDSKSVTE